MEEKEYTVKSIKRNFAEIEGEFVLYQTPQVEVIFKAQEHPGGVRGFLIKRRKGEVKGEKVDFRKLKPGEGVWIELPTDALTELVSRYVDISKQILQHGVPSWGRKEFIVAPKDQVVVTDTNKAEVIRQLISQGFTDELWGQLSPNVVENIVANKLYEQRKKALGVFKSMLASEKDEKKWQDFLHKNDWIFGYSLDYRFMGILQKEPSISATTIVGKDEGFSDFLLGDTRSVTFVEVKTPFTPLFGKSKNRTGAWKLSEELFDAVSQILEQKASGMTKINANKNYDSEGKLLKQSAHDSRVHLIVGSWGQIAFENEQVSAIKRKTFELYRRDSRNIEILTYDELYSRARFIVEGTKKERQEK